MREMGRQFVLGENIDKAMKRADGMQAKGFTYCYDMLGEAARTDADARALSPGVFPRDFAHCRALHPRHRRRKSGHLGQAFRAAPAL